MTGVLTSRLREDTGRQRQKGCVYKPRNAKDHGRHQKLRQRREKILLLEAWREHGPADITTFDFWPQELGEKELLLF